MLHLLMQIRPQLRLVIANKRQRRIVRPTEVSRLMECHRRSDVHIASVKDQVPSWWTLSTIKNRLIVHVQWKILDFEELWIVSDVANSRTHCECFIPIPEVVGGVDLGFVDVSGAGIIVKS